MSRAASSQTKLCRLGVDAAGACAGAAAAGDLRLLDEHEELVAKIRGDLRRGLKNPDTGRSGLAP